MPTFRELLRAARLLMDRRSVEQELDDELRFHLEMETRRNVERGMTPLEARSLAEKEFGAVGRVKTELQTVHSSGIPLAESIGSDLRYTARGLRRSPGFTAGAILTLALGIGANVTMFAMLEHLLLRAPASVADPQNVFVVQRFVPPRNGNESYTTQAFSYPRFKALRDAKLVTGRRGRDRGLPARYPVWPRVGRSQRHGNTRQWQLLRPARRSRAVRSTFSSRGRSRARGRSRRGDQ